jgi:hypothetical protein
MSFAHSQNAGIFVNQYNLTSHTRQMEIMAAIADHDSTVLGDSAVRIQLGLKSGGVRYQGLFDPTVGGAYDVLSAAYGSTTSRIATAFPELTTLGNPAVLCYALETELGIPVNVNDLVGLTAYLKAAEDGVDFGVWLQALAAVTNTGNGSSVDNAAATTNGGVGVIHTTAIAGAAPSVVWKIQHATDNSTWVDLITFTAATVASSERIEVAAGTTVNRYLRAIRTFGGTTTSITSAIAFARR